MVNLLTFWPENEESPNATKTMMAWTNCLLIHQTGVWSLLTTNVSLMVALEKAYLSVEIVHIYLYIYFRSQSLQSDSPLNNNDTQWVWEERNEIVVWTSKTPKKCQKRQICRFEGRKNISMDLSYLLWFQPQVFVVSSELNTWSSSYLCRMTWIDYLDLIML